MKKEYSPLWKSNLLLSAFSLIFVFLVLESGIRTYDAVKGDGFFSGRRNKLLKNSKPRPFRTFGFRLYKNENGVKYISSRHRELFPLKKPKGAFRIVALGGSTTENISSFKKAKIHYPLALQSALQDSLNTNKIEVINVGFSAYATPHSLILFQLDVLSWEPDMIIVSHNINDLLTGYWPNFNFDYSNKYSNKFYLPDYKSRFTFCNVLFQHSQLYWVICGLIKNMRNKSSREVKRKSYGNEAPQLLVETFKRNLRSFAAIAKENGIQVLLGSQPLQPSEKSFLRHMGYKPYNNIVTYPLHDEFVHHHKQLNKSIKQVAEETGVLFIDNENALSGNSEYFIDFVHYTPKGVRAVASNYVKFILGENIIQSTGQLE